MLTTTTTTTLRPPLSTDAGLQFRQKLLYLSSININLQKALTENPNLRSTPLSTLQSIKTSLSSMGLSTPSISRIFNIHPSLLTSDPHLHLFPIFDFLINEVQIPYPDIHKSISRCPRLLVSDVGSQLRPTLLFLESLGFVGNDKIDSQTSVLLVYNVENTLMVKIEFLMSLGFEFDEVKRMIVRSPGLLTFSVEKNLVPKFRFFAEEMKGDLEDLKRFPQYFSFSLERKIRPRYEMLVQNGLRDVPLSRMLKLSDGEFNVRLLDMRLRMVGGQD